MVADTTVNLSLFTGVEYRPGNDSSTVVSVYSQMGCVLFRVQRQAQLWDFKGLAFSLPTFPLTGCRGSKCAWRRGPGEKLGKMPGF